jgi:hypothetical protein
MKERMLRASNGAGLMLEVLAADEGLTGEEGMTLGVLPGAHSAEGADDGEGCEVSSLRGLGSGTDVYILQRRAPGRRG